ncbi:thioredoxin family protein [Butyricimonas hominis]|uniref:Thioredoxin fold domain-containing protein n=1 Tax=Butyricimonas hominis TaxID=2763032 RepID=A0ABR7CXJ3_9BACT|nr:thioredoxin domain-containing protein [Butyricimonas hominis]MBC5619875.1 thioredoxin fold domain-containing protein [Butyricimonas hominis]
MKRVYTVVSILFFSLVTFAQSGTRFMDNRPWQEVLQRAQRENKLIFVDCYTSWCGPCKQLATEIFPQEKMGEYLNKRFVNAKYDVEKGEGLAVGKQYEKEIKVFPTMLILTAQGEVIHKVSGCRPADELIAAIEEGLQGNTIYNLRKEYDRGNREWSFIQKFLHLLETASERKEYEKVAREYASRFPIDSLLNKDIWDIVGKFVIQTPFSPEFRFAVEHIDDLDSKGLVNRYQLESKLSEEMGFAVNSIFLVSNQKHSEDSLAKLQEKIDYLRTLLKKPVKGFPESLAELSIVESKIKNDTNQLYERLCVLVECGFANRDLFLSDMLKYLARNLNNEARLKRCINIAEYMKEISSKSSWVQEGFDEVITLANQKLESKK